VTQRKRWSPIRPVLYGVIFGTLAGGLMVWGTDRGDQWQHQAGTLLAITLMTTLACVVVSYVRQFVSN
jgi:predicted lipid-binding transport protein (Tim44 family)